MKTQGMYSFNRIITRDYTSCFKDLLWICQYVETTSQLVFIRIFLITMFTLLCLHCRAVCSYKSPSRVSEGTGEHTVEHRCMGIWILLFLELLHLGSKILFLVLEGNSKLFLCHLCLQAEIFVPASAELSDKMVGHFLLCTVFRLLFALRISFETKPK